MRVARMAQAAGCCLVLVLGTGAAAAQSLADIARAEEARRKALGSAGKVYTGETLRPAPPAPPVEQAAPAASEPAADEPEAEDPKQDEKTWRARIEGERSALQRAQMFAEALQSRINALSADFVARDDPAQRNQIGVERAKALAELSRVQQEIQQHTKNVAAIQDEARRAGVPAGWAR